MSSAVGIGSADPDRVTRSRLAGTVPVVVAVAGVALLLAFSERGAADPRIANPAGHGLSSPVDPALGWQNWPQIFELASIAMTVTFVGVFGWLSRRSGRLHPGLVLTIALTGVGFLLEPAANWACYCAYDPELLHLPVSWGYVSVAPVVQPIVNMLGYPYYLLIPALPAFGLWRWRARRSVTESFVNRRPLIALFLCGYLVGTAFDLVAQFGLFPSGVLVWTQIAGPAIRAGEPTQYPVLTAVVWPVLTGVTTLFFWRDDTGRTPAARLAMRFDAFRHRPVLGEIGVAWVVLTLTYLVWIGFFGAIRLSGQAKTLARPWTFPETKVFDPDGYYRDAGEPGPYFTGPLWGGR